MIAETRPGPANDWEGEADPGHRGRIASWLASLALVAAVVLLATHRAEERELVNLVEQSQPLWLIVAVALQAATYLLLAGVWRATLARRGEPLPLTPLIRLSLAKLFTDQAVPSLGLGGSLLVARSFVRRGVSRATAVGALVVEIVANRLAYGVAIAAALVALASRDSLGPAVTSLAGVFAAVALALPLALVLARERLAALLARRPRWRAGRKAAALLAECPEGLLRDRRLLLRAYALELAIFAVDAATLWVCLRALGVSGDPFVVFAAFVIASVAASLGVVPGGLGVFEGASVGALHLLGIPIGTALAGTLLLRGATFWLPMIPGLWAARREMRRAASPGGRPMGPAPAATPWWSRPGDEVAADLGSGPRGLSGEEARRRLAFAGRNRLAATGGGSVWRHLGRQLGSPLTLVLIVAAGISALVHETVDAGVILVIVGASAVLSTVREVGAASAVERLRRRLVLRVRVVRDGAESEVPVEEVVPGDHVLLRGGSLVPGDGVLVEATDLFVNESVLTGETFPAEKRVGPSPPEAPLAGRLGAVFQGTSVRSGFGRVLVVATGTGTALGKLAAEVARRRPETEFERGIRRFGFLLTRIMFVLVLVVFTANVLDAKPPVDSLLFALALAVGMSPELLPAIVAANLSRGAKEMAARGVIVRRLDAIENFGSMDVLCVDKTGTLTAGVVTLEAALDATGARSEEVLRAASLNALLESGLANPLDDAIRTAAAARGIGLGGAEKRGEVPYDFVRKRLSVAIREPAGERLVTKGAFENVLAVCTAVAGAAENRPLDEHGRDALRARFAAWSEEGKRVLGVADRALAAGEPIGREAEAGMTFRGFLLFSDRPKPKVAEHVEALRALGVELKMLTGDNRRVAAHVAREVGLLPEPALTGPEVDRLRSDALARRAAEVQLFAELEPQHKERVLRALQRSGRVVGFLGDGINDAPALHAADVGISVDGAVDVARESADFVLLESDLGVLREGILQGRRTFANTMKYVNVTSSANFGNMVSMALASAGLPFLPLLAKQILLNNLLSDVPAIALAGDDVDSEILERPRRWDLRRLRDVMIVFGLVSSAFDLLLFGLLLAVLRTPAAVFRTAWFVASLLTELAVLFLLRTERPVLVSRPSRPLLAVSVAVAAVALALPYVPLAARPLGLVPLTAPLLLVVVGITVAYAVATEAAKRPFARRHRP